MGFRRLLTVALAVLVLIGAAACSSADSSDGNGGSAAGTDAGELFPDIEKVEVTGGGGTYTFDVTVSSPYDSPDRYADSIRVRSIDGSTVYGERTLAHDHAGEQPFTRSVDAVEIPGDVSEVVVEGRDQESGWGGGTQTVKIP